MSTDINILLIEDNPGDARLIREMLIGSSEQRFELDWVVTLGEGLEHVSQHSYDTILLDLSLPDSMSIDTLSTMVNTASDTAIVVLTGLENEQLGIEAVQQGAQDYVPKDQVDSRLLTRSIRYAIERKQSEMVLRQQQAEYRSLIDDVFDTSMVAVLILDRSYNVIWCNEATVSYFGIARDRLLHRDKRTLVDSELKCVFADPDDYAAHILKSYEEQSFTQRFECHVLPDENRTERWLEHWSQPIRGGIYKGGRIEQYTDITDRKLLEIAEQEQREFAEALHVISTLLTSSLDLNEVLDNILANLGRVVPHNSASITIIDDDDESQRSEHHEVDDILDTQEIAAVNEPQFDYTVFADEMVTTGQPVIINDLKYDLRTEFVADFTQIRSYVGIPIQLKDNVIGFINLFSQNPNFFNKVYEERLLAFSKLAAIAIQNAQMFLQSRQLAALEERQRLARELHDSVSQTLFTCRTMSESALRRWERDPQRSYELIKDVNHLTTTALTEMRILLLELRPAVLQGTDLKRLFEQYLRPIQKRREFKLTLAIDDIPPLPPEVQLAFYRITQEALNNINKHAQARNVEVRAVDQPKRIILVIRDDGHGFELSEVSRTSLGLRSMSERAEEINASLDIASTINEGTQITIIWNKDKHV